MSYIYFHSPGGKNTRVRLLNEFVDEVYVFFMQFGETPFVQVFR